MKRKLKRNSRRTKRNRGFVPYTGTPHQIAVRMAGYTAADERELLEKGNGIFWRIRRDGRGGVLIKVYDDKRVAKNLGVAYTGNIIHCEMDTVLDQAKFDEWLSDLARENGLADEP